MPPRFKLKIVIVVLLMLAPVTFLAAIGSYHLWQTGWGFIAWIGMATSFLVGYWLGRRWTRKARTELTLPPPEQVVAPPTTWTERDGRAWEIVKAHAAASPPPSADALADYHRNATDLQDLALKVAQVYAPGTKDPFGHLTLPELLACSQLVADDLADLVDRYAVGSRFVTIGTLRRAQKVGDWMSRWYPRVRDWYYIGSAVFNPVQAAAQAIATKGMMGSMFKEMQGNALAWFQTVAIHEFGRYLIELNSGRLKVGAKRYRELMSQGVRVESVDVGVSGGASEKPSSEVPTDSGTDPTTHTRIKLAILGPVKAGKSSLVNAILGEQLAATDTLPLTLGATQYTLREGDTPALTVIDTAGFGNDGANDADLAAALVVAQDSDVLILATPANNAARKPEVEFLEKLRAAFLASPQLKMPPVVVAITKADLLSPKAEWQPPYDWQKGTRLKEQTMREAVAAAKEAFGAIIKNVIPVVGAEGRVFGVRDQLLGTIADLLGDARGGALLRTLHAEGSAKGWRDMTDQIANLFGWARDRIAGTSTNDR